MAEEKRKRKKNSKQFLGPVSTTSFDITDTRYHGKVIHEIDLYQPKGINRVIQPGTAHRPLHKQSSLSLVPSYLQHRMSSPDVPKEEDDTLSSSPPDLSAFKSFYTPSQMLSTMNNSLAVTMPVRPGAEAPSVSLQKKLPNGGTVQASKSEMSMNDAKAKISQAAALVSAMKNYAEKSRWREKQRICANETFHVGTEDKIREAMDLYLTCMVVDDGEREDSFVGVDPEGRPRILQNLIICGIALKEYKKACEFGKLLLNDLRENEGDSAPLEVRQKILGIKIKSSINVASCHCRLGNWSDAKELFEEAEKDATEVQDPEVRLVYEASLMKERQRLQKNKNAEKKSEARMKSTMKKRFTKQSTDSAPAPTTTTTTTMAMATAAGHQTAKMKEQIKPRRTHSKLNRNANASLQNNNDNDSTVRPKESSIDCANWEKYAIAVLAFLVFMIYYPRK